MNLRDIARQMGIPLTGLETKRMLERMIDSFKASSNGNFSNFPYRVEPPNYQQLQTGNKWTVRFVEGRRPGTFDIIPTKDEPYGSGKDGGLTIEGDVWDFICELNKYNKTNWKSKLVNSTNTAYWISRRGGTETGKLYIPAPSIFTGQVRVLNYVGRWAEIKAIDVLKLPPVTDELRQDRSVIDIFHGWNGKTEIWGEGYPIYVPKLRRLDHVYIDMEFIQ